MSYGTAEGEMYEADQFDYQESGLVQSVELNREIKSTSYRYYTIVAVVVILLGSTLYLSSSVRGNQSRPLFSIPKFANSDVLYEVYTTKPTNTPTTAPTCTKEEGFDEQEDDEEEEDGMNKGILMYM
jgi:hypothetical protein